ncbi:hypothetical protein V8J88_08055 [Massilia sp. W12]|uniref:ExbD/TolR family protein n=1 Tax=Massilia sp. W12 TaxID=3126507 RepID=UPI0030CEDE1D
MLVFCLPRPEHIIEHDDGYTCATIPDEMHTLHIMADGALVWDEQAISLPAWQSLLKRIDQRQSTVSVLLWTHPQAQYRHLAHALKVLQQNQLHGVTISHQRQTL